MPVIREKRQYESVRRVGVVRMDTGEAEKYKGIAAAVNSLTKIAVDEMGRQAEKQGEQMAQQVAASKIMSINPKTGKPEALDWVGDNRFIGRTGANAYARVISDRFQQEIENEIKQKAGKIALQYENDPYSVEKYEEQMNAYLEGMAKGSEENGKQTAYTNFILSEGTQYITATKLNMMQERNRRERAKLAASIEQKNNEMLEFAYNAGVEGRADFDNILDASVDRNLDGEAAALIQRGSATAHDSKMRTAYVSGAVQRIFQKLDGRPYDRARVELAIRIGNVDSLPNDLKDEVADIIPLVDLQNRGSILTNAAQLSADYAAVEMQQEKIEAENMRRLSRQISINLDSENTKLEYGTFSTITNAYNSGDPKKVTGAIQAAVTDAEIRINDIKLAFADGLIGKDDYTSRTKEARQSVLTPILAVAAQEGNVEDLSLAIRTGNPIAYNRLTPFQRSVVESLGASPNIYDRVDDETFVKTYLSGAKDEVTQRMNDYLAASQIKAETENLISGLYRGEFDEEATRSLASQINQSTILSDSDKDTLKKRINTGYAVGLVNQVAGASSSQMNAMGLYISSNGADDLGLPKYMRGIADNVLAITTDENRDKIVSEISKRESSIRTNEQEIKSQQDQINKQAKLFQEARFGGVSKTKEHREIVDTMLVDRGIDLLSPDSENPETYRILSNTMSQNLLDGLHSLVSSPSSFSPQQANTLMNHFARLYQDPTTLGMVNRFGNLLGEDEAILRHAMEVRQFVQKPVNEIFADLQNRTQTKAATDNYESVFGSRQKDAAETYVFDLFNDRNIARELAPLASYYAKTGRDKNSINALLEDVVDSRYKESEFIADPSMPKGMVTKSRYSLEITFPDKDERKEFISRVQSELPSGYSIKGTRTARTGEVTFGEDKQVYLVPYAGTGVPQYFAHYVEPETNELRPLIYERTKYNANLGRNVTETVWPMFDHDLTEDWRKDKLLQEIEDAQATVDNIRKSKEVLQKRPGIR